MWKNQTECSLRKRTQCTNCVPGALSVGVQVPLNARRELTNRFSISAKCHHAIKHRCHKGECPPCGQVCGLPNDTSGCGHICKSRCHEAIRVNKPSETRPQAKKVSCSLLNGLEYNCFLFSFSTSINRCPIRAAKKALLWPALAVMRWPPGPAGTPNQVLVNGSVHGNSSAEITSAPWSVIPWPIRKICNSNWAVLHAKRDAQFPDRQDALTLVPRAAIRHRACPATLFWKINATADSISWFTSAASTMMKMALFRRLSIGGRSYAAVAIAV